MKFGTIGAAKLAQAFATLVIKAGHEVVLSNSRGPEYLGAVVDELGKGASAGSREMAASMEIVLLAVPWPKVENALAGLQNWDQRILLDATNAFLSYAPNFKKADMGDRVSSEIVASYAPGARVVKVLNTLNVEKISADPVFPSGNRVLFLAGDDEDAKFKISELIASMRFSPIDLGSLSNGGRLMQLGGVFSGSDFIKNN